MSTRLLYEGDSSDSDYEYSTSSYYHSRPESSAGRYNATPHRRKRFNKSNNYLYPSSSTPSPPTTSSERSRSPSPSSSSEQEKSGGQKLAYHQERQNINVTLEQETEDSNMSFELEEAARRTMPELITAMDNMMALFSPRKTLARTPPNGIIQPPRPAPPHPPEVDPPFRIEQLQAERPRRRRNSPVRFEFQQNRLPLSPPLIWWAKEGCRQSQVEQSHSQNLEPVREDLQRQVSNQQVSNTQFKCQGLQNLKPSTIPKLPKIANPSRLPAENERERGQPPLADLNSQVRHCQPMTRLEKLAGRNHSPICTVPVQQQFFPHSNFRPENGAGPGVLPQISQPHHLPHFMLSEPMRFRPVFIKPPKPIVPPARQFQPIPNHPPAMGTNGTKPAKKELPDHLRFGNFNIKRNVDRRPLVELPPTKTTRVMLKPKKSGGMFFPRN